MLELNLPELKQMLGVYTF